MKKLLSKILPCLLVALLVVGLAGCNKKYKHPKESPMVSNAGEVFLSLGNKNFTNEQVYNRLLQTYGLDTVITWMDEVILANTAIDDQEAYEEQMNYIIYGTTDLSDLTEEEKAEAKAEFEKSMFAQGYENEAEWNAYYQLEFKRYSEGLKAFEQYADKLNADSDESKHILKDEDYQVAYETLYQSDYTVILLTFDSEFEARKILAENNVNINKLTFGWENAEGTAYDAAGVKAIFTNIYNSMNSDEQPEKTYKFMEKSYANELAKISSVIASKVSSLETMEENLGKSYTHAPLIFGNRYYLVLKVSETEIEAEYKNATDEQKAAVKEYLMESLVSSDYLLYAAQLNHVASKVKFYDEALEIGYNKYYNENVEAVGVKLEDNQKFKTTKDESSKVVAEITVNGKKHELTADALFERLLKQYGPALALLYTQEYTVLSNPSYNKVTDYLNGKVLDQETYDKYYKTDVNTYKEKLEKGEYEADGFPANYGWEQFMVDYLGVSSEFELMHTYGSSIYKAAEENYIKDIYMGEEVTEEKDGETIVVKTKDQAVQDEMQKIFDDFFSSTMVGAYAYFDANNDGIADEMTEEQTAKAKALVNLAYESAKAEQAKEVNGTLAAGLQKVVDEYKATAFFEVNKWQEYKKAGLKLTLISSTTYTNTSSVADEIKEEAKAQWNLVKNYKTLEGNSNVDPLGQTLDPGYRKSVNNNVYYVTSAVFGDQREAFVANNAAYRLVITKATDHTYIKKSTGLFKPTLAEYEAYQKDSSNVSSSVATAIKTYYTTAIANLASTQIVNDTLFKDAEDLINASTVKFVAKPAMKDTVLKLISNSYSEQE